MMKINNSSIFSPHFMWLMFITIIAYLFFDYNPFQESSIVKLSSMLLVIVLLFYSLGEIKNRKDSFSQYVRIILVLFAISMVNSWLFWGQSLLLSFRASFNLFYYVLFFYFLRTKPSIHLLEKYILIVAFLYTLLWLFALSQWPNPIFGVQDERSFEDLSRGFMRVYFVGNMNCVFAFFLCLVKFTNTSKIKYLALMLYFFTIIVLQVTRQVIFFSFIIGAVYYFYFKRRKFLIYSIALLLISFIVIPKVLEGDNVISALVEYSEKQQETHETGNTDIRILEYEFFFTGFTKNAVTIFLGNGMPHTEGSYGKIVDYWHDRAAYYMTDVGYAYIYVVIGIVGLIIFILLLYNAIKTKVPKDYAYVKLFAIFAIFGNIASGMLLERSGIFCLCISLYVMVTVNRPDRAITCNKVVK